MGNVAAIDGVTGPGRKVVLILGEVQEVNFKLKKKVIEVINKDGSMGQYDLYVASTVQVSMDGQDFTLAVTSKEVDDGGSIQTYTDAERARTTTNINPSNEGGGQVKVTRPDTKVPSPRT